MHMRHSPSNSMRLFKVVLLLSFAYLNSDLAFKYLVSLHYAGDDINGASFAVLPFLVFILTCFNGSLFFLLRNKTIIWELLNIGFIFILLFDAKSMPSQALLILFLVTFGIKYIWLFISAIQALLMRLINAKSE